MIAQALTTITDLVALGGAVVAILLALSVVAGAAVLLKLWQMLTLGVGRHAGIDAAIAAADRGDAESARRALAASGSHLAPALTQALDGAGTARTEAEAGASIARVEQGFRFLDLTAQIAPLLGLFGTVQGMIQAFQAMQAAGSSVNPSILAGGIWVALLTTIVGLAVAMPVTVVLSWFESRAARERVIADRAIQALVAVKPAQARRHAA
jgi:biopolymer transport protein ExbB